MQILVFHQLWGDLGQLPTRHCPCLPPGRQGGDPRSAGPPCGQLCWNRWRGWTVPSQCGAFPGVHWLVPLVVQPECHVGRPAVPGPADGAPPAPPPPARLLRWPRRPGFSEVGSGLSLVVSAWETAPAFQDSAAPSLYRLISQTFRHTQVSPRGPPLPPEGLS